MPGGRNRLAVILGLAHDADSLKLLGRRDHGARSRQRFNAPFDILKNGSIFGH